MISEEKAGYIARAAQINNCETGTITQVSRTGKYRVQVDRLGEIYVSDASGLSDLVVGDRVSLRLYAGGIGTAEIAGRTARRGNTQPLIVWR